ncbi:MAG TPA: phosphoribosyltransferase family protein [Candidatus Saccharimonadales bacterium]|jgi:ComF family protein|nr:phosphoribosyltransferase family protein [Candidatus Saccharimonadales bacterium]
MSIFELIISFVAPHECLACGVEGHLLCRCCAAALPVAQLEQKIPGTQQVWPGVIYEGLAKSVVHALKFERAGAAAKDIADSIAADLPRQSDWLVTHLPTAPARVRQRGYDQSRLIARLVADRIGAPYAPLLARTTAVRQVGATRAQRKQQMRTAFRPLRGQSFPQRHILLIDDVLTTGATIEAAAAVLLAAGAARVSAAVFAAAPFNTSKNHPTLV